VLREFSESSATARSDMTAGPSLHADLGYPRLRPAFLDPEPRATSGSGGPAFSDGRRSRRSPSRLKFVVQTRRCIGTLRGCVTSPT
jgi:hypothetical protein